MPIHTVYDRTRQVTVDGDLIATATSRSDPGKQRWAEYRLFRLTHGGYLVAGVGRSAIRGESDRAWVRRAETAAAVLLALELEDRNRPGVSRIPYTALMLLDEAAETDPEIAKVHRSTT